MKRRFGFLLASCAVFLAVPPAFAQPLASGSFLAGRFAQAEGDWPRASGFFNQAMLADPGNPALLRQGFLLALASGQVEAARNLGREILAQGKPYHMAEVLAIADSFVAGQNEKAAGLIKAMPEDGLGGLLKPLFEGWNLAAVGKFDEAMARLQPKDADEGMGALYAFHIGLISELAGRPADAEKWYRKSLDEAATSRAAQALSAMLQKQNRMDEAGKVLADMEKDMPGWERGPQARMVPLIEKASDGAAELLFDMALVLGGQGMGEAASLYAQVALVMKPEFPEVRVLLGEILLESGQSAMALEQYRHVPASSWASWSARIGMAKLLEDMKRNAEAEALLRQMAAEAPKDALPLVRLADFLRRQDKFAEAAKVYEGALALMPEGSGRAWELHYWRGASLEQAKNWKDAEAELRQALTLAPDQPLVLNYLGYSLADRGEKLDEAFAMLQKAAELRPEGFILDSLGWAHFRLGQFDDAVRYLEQAVELEPADETLNDHLGDAYWRAGREREARYQWARARGLSDAADFQKAEDAKISSGLPELVQGAAKPVAE